MAKRKTAAEWRAFLRALERTGNARAAARAAGMDVGTAYDQRIKEPRFEARWERALAKARAREARIRAGSGRGPLHRLRRSPSPANAGEELVVRATRHGTRLVAAGAGRWNARAEARFRAALRRTGCVRAAARACGFSANALYRRRDAYPEFAAAWAADLAVARRRLPELLSAAAIASIDPDLERDELIPVNVDQAIAICRLKGFTAAPGAGEDPDEPPVAEVRASILRKLDALEAHEARRAAAEEGRDGQAEEPLHQPSAGPPPPLGEEPLHRPPAGPPPPLGEEPLHRPSAGPPPPLGEE